MPEFLGDTPPTRAALLALKDERQLMKEGYDFLDEKRLLLAAEMLRVLAQFAEHSRRLREAQARATRALTAAIGRHGLEALEVYPAPPHATLQLRLQQRSFLGVRLLDTRFEQEAARETGRSKAVFPSAEALACADAFRELLELSAMLAGVSGNLHRMMAEYRRTQRRAKALEDVILPEIEAAVAEMETRLEETDQEEAIRVRLRGRTATQP